MSGWSSPLRQYRSEVFPAPLGPTMDVRPLYGILTEQSRRILVFPAARFTDLACTAAASFVAYIVSEHPFSDIWQYMAYCVQLPKLRLVSPPSHVD